MSQQLVDILIPTHQNIFIIPDPVSSVLGVGLGGGTIEAPETYLHRVNMGHNHTGIVEFAGWEALRWWPDIIGKRVAWSRTLGTILAPQGAEKRVHLSSIADITCYFDQGTPEGHITEAWIEFSQARPGTLLVERVDPPSYRGSIIIPDGHRTAYRQSEAVIISAGEGIDKATYFPGRRVFLPAESNKRIEFGERSFYQIFVGAIVGIFKEDAESLKVDRQLPDPALQMASVEPSDDRFDEGDLRGPR